MKNGTDIMVDEELLLRIRDAEAQAKKIIEDAGKKRQEMIRQAMAEAMKTEEKELNDLRKRLDAEAKKEEKKIEEERNALLAEGLKETERIRKAAEKNAEKALGFLRANLENVLKGRKNVLSGKNV